MKTLTLPILLSLFAGAAAHADEVRQLEAHEHGVGRLDIALDGTTVAISFEAPGADIVGFEYAPETETDMALVKAAVADLEAPLSLFAMPASAGCGVTSAKVTLLTDSTHASDHDHGHNQGGEQDHAHDHDHEVVAHSEFRADYMLTCADPAAIDRIVFPYFDRFPNALELEVQVVTPRGASAFDVRRDAPSIDLGGLI
jgi:hypothetical protein